MIDDAQEILNYLPREYKTVEEQEYVNFLWDAFVTNYQNAKYQFAYIAYHMLFMSFTYYSIWKLKQFRKADFEKAVIHLDNDACKEFNEAEWPLSLAEIERLGESRIFRFFKLAGCNGAEIGEFVNIVKSRNNVAHANGHIFYKTSESLDEQLQKILTCAERIQTSLICVLDEMFPKFLEERCLPTLKESFDDKEQFKEFLIRDNYLSDKDLERCLLFNVSSLSGSSNFASIETMADSFKKEYGAN